MALFDSKVYDMNDGQKYPSDSLRKRGPPSSVLQAEKSRDGNLKIQRSLGIQAKANLSISIPQSTNNTLLSTKHNISDVVEKV